MDVCEATRDGTVSAAIPIDDLSRDVYGLLGVPIDAVDMATVLFQIKLATANELEFLISTANLNFLTTSLSNPDFRESLLSSDLCTADGVAIVWLGRLLGIPLRERIAGADIFESLKSAQTVADRLKVFLIGGEEGVAAGACQKLNSENTKILCVGTFYPGFGSIEDMSTPPIFQTINNSGADFLAVALGAQRGQAWLLRNHHAIQVPVRVHLGATINFQAGIIKRAPIILQKCGLEWLWRIKEEPKLWRRYWNDGKVLLALLLNHVVPLLLLRVWDQLKLKNERQDLQVRLINDHDFVTIELSGAATKDTVTKAVAEFKAAVGASKNVTINFANTRQIDARFLGLILMLNKQLKKHGHRLGFTGVSSRIGRRFRLNGFDFLLQASPK
jgi:N-acetylglucosaminyldiphosphoundecaprenol N-acetyl-beta-D-mannosaminyltransferase